MHQPAWEYSGPDFVEFARECLLAMRPVFGTAHEVFIYAGNGHAAWEAALVNTLSPGDRVLVPETGNFSKNWSLMAESLGLEVEYLESDWRRAIDPQQIEDRLRSDEKGEIKAVLAVHIDTATGVTSDIEALARAIEARGHSAMLMVDVIASLACVPFPMDEWRVDVAVGASQKGLMGPPGLGFTAAGPKAVEASKRASSARSYFNWETRSVSNPENYRWFCGTAPEHLLFALREAINMLDEEGMAQVFARHRRLADAVRAAVEVWSAAGAMEFNASIPAERADSITTIRVTDRVQPAVLQTTLRDRFNVSIGGGLGQLQGKAFRIGHMGDVNDAMILGTLASVESAFRMLDIPATEGGISAAMQSLVTAHGHAR
jgi:alanine-glyoxylate transaminase/serine-glyoxylate transaminase/serine-pyruvate transaminase